MERLRLAVICSHLKPVDRRPTVESAVPWELSPSACHGGVGRPEEAAIKEGCVFCLIVRGDSPAYKLYEDDVCLCILDSNPLCSGHSLLIPKFHFPSLQDTPPTVIAALCSIVPFLTGAIVTATQSDSFNLLVNNGTAAGQVIFHTHFHIIPRRAGDQLWPSEEVTGHSHQIKMKHFLKILGFLVTISALWIGLLEAAIVPRNYALLLPVYLIVVLGCYGLLMVGVGLMFFPICPQESQLLQKDIIEAKEFLKNKGLDVHSDQNAVIQ